MISRSTEKEPGSVGQNVGRDAVLLDSRAIASTRGQFSCVADIQTVTEGESDPLQAVSSTQHYCPLSLYLRHSRPFDQRCPRRLRPKAGVKSTGRFAASSQAYGGGRASITASGVVRVSPIVGPLLHDGVRVEASDEVARPVGVAPDTAARRQSAAGEMDRHLGQAARA